MFREHDADVIVARSGSAAQIERLVELDLLATEARRRGLGDSPSVRDALASALLAVEFASVAAPTDAEVDAYFEAHREAFVRPESVRVRVIVVDDGREARSLVDRLSGLDSEAFTAAARTSSRDAVSAPAGGDLAFVTREELARRYGESVAGALFAAEDGAVVGPMAVGGQQLVARREAARPGLARSAKDPEVRANIAQRILNARRETKRRSLLAVLRAQHGAAVAAGGRAASLGGSILEPRRGGDSRKESDR